LSACPRMPRGDSKYGLPVRFPWQRKFCRRMCAIRPAACGNAPSPQIFRHPLDAGTPPACRPTEFTELVGKPSGPTWHPGGLRRFSVASGGSTWLTPPSDQPWFHAVYAGSQMNTSPGLGASAGPGDEPAEGQRGLGRVSEPFSNHGCPKGQDRGAVHADRGRYGGHGQGAYRLARGAGTHPGTRRHRAPGGPATAGLGGGCVKARFRAGVAKCPIVRKLPGERRIQKCEVRSNGVAHCRYGTTFSHSLGGNRTFGGGS